MKTLHLTLSKKPFEVMVTGEKTFEFRKPSNWIKSRLYEKGYDVVKFINGYGADKPYFIAEYRTFWRTKSNSAIPYSNGLIVNVEDGDFVISIGKILETGNLLID